MTPCDDAKRTAEVWAMPADEVSTEEKGKYNTYFEVVEGYRKAIAEFKRDGCDWDRLDPCVRSPWERPLNAPMPRWPKRR